MKKIKNIDHFTNINPHYDYAPIYSYIPKRVLFFDIETTGFSTVSSRLYLIGAAYFSDMDIDKAPNTDPQDETVLLQNPKKISCHVPALIVEQFFAQSAEDEPALLSAFANLVQHFDTLISYHGAGFDLPFLNSCQKRLGLDFTEVYEHKNCIDLYHLARSFRHLLPLCNYKQRALEDFISYKRKDVYTGGELIEVYKNYLHHPEDALFQILIQHNYEDLTGMAALLSLYAYEYFLDGQFTVCSCNCQTYAKQDGTIGKEFIITCRLFHSLPAGFSCNNSIFYLHCTKNAVKFRIPVYEGTLKYFYHNYKDYYYLPNEDLALHKSVAAYVDKAHRKKATAATCYTKKTGTFLPQYQEVQMPALFMNYKDRISYFELTEQFTNSPDICKQYCMHILHILKTGKYT